MNTPKKVLIYILAIVAIVFVTVFVVKFLDNEVMPLVGYDEEFQMSNKSTGIASFAESSDSQNEPMADEGELTERKIIKNGSLELLVKKVEETAKSISQIAIRFDGFVSSSNIYEVSQDNKAGYVTIRMPIINFDLVIEELKELAIKVEKESIDARDVTEEFIDLEARLKNLEAQENQYLEIMKRAIKIEEILSVTDRLSNVRSQIERIEGQLKYLTDKIDMATISIKLTSEADVEVFGVKWRPLYILKQSFRRMLTSLTGYIDTIIALIFLLPSLILWIITISLILFVGYKIINWAWHRFFSNKLNNQ